MRNLLKRSETSQDKNFVEAVNNSIPAIEKDTWKLTIEGDSDSSKARTTFMGVVRVPRTIEVVGKAMGDTIKELSKVGKMDEGELLVKFLKAVTQSFTS